MVNDKNLIKVEGTLPRYDKNGNDLTGYILGPGGFRKKNGELVAQVSNIKIKNDFQTDPSSLNEFSNLNNDSSTGDGLKSAVMGLAIIGVFAVAFRVAPHIKNWCDKNVLPNLKKDLHMISKEEDSSISIMESKEHSSIELSFPKDAVIEDLPFEEYQTTMSKDEALQHVIAARLAFAFAIGEIKKLSGAKIEGDEEYLHFNNIPQRFSSPQITPIIIHMLKNNVLLDENTSDAIYEYFSSGMFINGKYVPIGKVKIKEILCLDERIDNC